MTVDASTRTQLSVGAAVAGGFLLSSLADGHRTKAFLAADVVVTALLLAIAVALALPAGRARQAVRLALGLAAAAAAGAIAVGLLVWSVVPLLSDLSRAPLSGLLRVVVTLVVLALAAVALLRGVAAPAGPRRAGLPLVALGLGAGGAVSQLTSLGAAVELHNLAPTIDVTLVVAAVLALAVFVPAAGRCGMGWAARLTALSTAVLLAAVGWVLLPSLLTGSLEVRGVRQLLPAAVAAVLALAVTSTMRRASR